MDFFSRAIAFNHFVSQAILSISWNTFFNHILLVVLCNTIYFNKRQRSFFCDYLYFLSLSVINNFLYLWHLSLCCSLKKKFTIMVTKNKFRKKLTWGWKRRKRSKKPKSKVPKMKERMYEKTNVSESCRSTAGERIGDRLCMYVMIGMFSS